MNSALRTIGAVSGSAVLDQVIVTFAQAWQEGSHPSIEQVISTLGGDDAETVLFQLIRVEVMHRLALGKEVDVDTYVARFPAHAEKLRNWLSSQLNVEIESLAGSTIALPVHLNTEPETHVYAFRVFGRYQLRAFLGRGGFGEVWRAYDPELRREVAIKTPRDALKLSSELRRQFVAEGRKAAKLRHHGVVRVYDAGEAQGKCYIVSELIDGGTLRQLVQREPLSERQKLTIVRDVAEALHYAHSQGIVHRDIKPGNILIDSEGRAHISDFGLAKMEGPGGMSMSSGECVVGTPAYMSPEQSSGRSQEADGRTDIYSLGVVLFELLTATPLNDLRRALLAFVEEGKSDAFQVENIASKDFLQAVCRKALALRPADRFANAAEFCTELSTLLQADADTLTSLPNAKRHRALVGTIVLAVVAAMLLGFVAIESHLTKGVPVQITTDPIGARLTFIPIAASTGVPLAQEARSVGLTPVKRRLAPGKYLVVAVLGTDRFHEVYRTIPPPTEEVRGSVYWHSWWQREEDGTILLPTINVPPADVADGMQHLGGSDNFRAIEDRAGASEVQWTTVPEFYAEPTKVNRRIFDERIGHITLPIHFTSRPAAERAPFEEGQAPLTYISWDEAAHYAERAGMRLIEEAEYAFAVSLAVAASGVDGGDGDWLATPAEWTNGWATSGSLWPHGQVVSSSSDDRVVRGRFYLDEKDAGLVASSHIFNTRTFIDKRDVSPNIGFRFVRSSKPRLTPTDFVRPSSGVLKDR